MIKNLFFIFVLFGISSCALMIDGTKQKMSFDSNEKNVEIYIDSKFACQTPCITDVKRGNKPIMITAKKSGFEDKTVFLNKNLNSSSAFNLLSVWTSTFGFTTDTVSGSVWEYQPNSVYVVVTKEPKTATERQNLVEQNKIRNFVLVNFDQLQSDIFDDSATGEYIKSLSQMTKINTFEIKSVVQKSYTAADCAERIVGLYLTK